MLPSLGIMQPGAAVTDWMLAATCFACAMGLHFRKMEQKPRYYKMVVCALVAEALGCVAGGASWAMGTNLKEQADLSLVDWIVVLCTVLGMCGQGLGLIAAAVAYYPTTSDETNFESAMSATCDEGRWREMEGDGDERHLRWRQMAADGGRWR